MILRPHVIPCGNNEPVHTAGRSCPCEPFYPDDLQEPITHHAFDKREQFERQGHVRPGNFWIIVNEDISANNNTQ